ncbi:hypothetical protein [Acetobacter conturbans]|uniref:hypothetical protein n=1 Tax=Acetobacter conturbans TaxID=1737472 RepID=UPI001569BD94|nr:hypothetical protein [Acetobacter conturbans]
MGMASRMDLLGMNWLVVDLAGVSDGVMPFGQRRMETRKGRQAQPDRQGGDDGT